MEQNSIWHPTDIQWQPNEQKWGAKWFGAYSKQVWSVMFSSSDLNLFLTISLSLSCILDNKWHDFFQHIPAFSWCVNLHVCVFSVCMCIPQSWLMDDDRAAMQELSCIFIFVCLENDACLQVLPAHTRTLLRMQTDLYLHPCPHTHWHVGHKHTHTHTV